MSKFSTSLFRLSVKISQLGVNGILKGTVKMGDWFILALVLSIGTLGIASYALGHKVGSIDAWKHAKSLLQDTAKVAQHDEFRTTWKG